MIAAPSTPGWIALGISATTLAWTMFWSVWQNRRSTRPRIKGRAAIGVTGLPAGPIKPYLIVEAANVGPVPVTLNSVVLHVRGHQEQIVTIWQWQTPSQLPIRLEPGAGHWTGLGDLADLKRGLAAQLGPRQNWHIRADFGIIGGRRFLSKAGRRWGFWPRRWTRIF